MISQLLRTTTPAHPLLKTLALALILQFTLWFVDSFIENCFATALLGLVYGPLFVAGLGLVNELLPVDLHMIAMQIW
jgi:hypothetical protein